MRNILILILFFSISLNSYSIKVDKDGSTSIENSEKKAVNDGPYVFIKEDHLVEKNIILGKVDSTILPLDAYTIEFPNSEESFKDVKKIAALSDIHGQFDLMIKILENNKIIDKKHKWSYGKGHLVIVGDVFDRGPKVTEALWFIYNLEQEAAKKGGKVHFLLGNHEYIVLHNDLRYIHSNYELTSKLLDTSYPALYGINTVLGRWLRSKATIIEINNVVFVHGGISKKFLSNGFEISEVNTQMRIGIDRDKEEMKSTSFWKTYYGSDGPVWYRGYFNDDLSKKEINEILKEVDTEHIVVGHCSNKHVVSLYDDKIFGVDSSIKKGKSGEILFIKDDKYSRGTKKGKKKHFD